MQHVAKCKQPRALTPPRAGASPRVLRELVAVPPVCGGWEGGAAAPSAAGVSPAPGLWCGGNSQP